jgi:hypothetical protein
LPSVSTDHEDTPTAACAAADAPMVTDFLSVSGSDGVDEQLINRTTTGTRRLADWRDFMTALH